MQIQSGRSFLRAAFLISLFLPSASLVAPLHAQEEPPSSTAVFTVISRNSSISLVEKTSRIVQLGARIKTVDGFDPTVIKVTAVSEPNQIRLQAIAAGVTTLLLTDEHGTAFNLEVLVSGDVKQLEALIRKAFPDASVQAIKIKDSVLLHGWVNQPEQLTTIVHMAEQFHPNVINSMRVSGIQQVVLQVKIMEVQRAKLRRMGFNFLNLQDNSYVTSTPGGLAPVLGVTAPLGGPAGAALTSAATGAAPPTAAFGIISDNNVFQGFIEMLKSESLLKILAEPNLMTVNGRPASFLAGGQFPIPIPQGLGTVSIQFKPFGVQLEFVPIVLGNGRLRMEVAPEVSEKDFSTVVNVNGNTIPGLSTRKVNTQVEMSFGQTLIIAGLISNRVQATTDKVPYLGDLPWIGAAFRRVRHDESETELLIMVTPEFVAPMDPGQVPPGGPGSNTFSPTDSELYGNGQLETPRYCPDPNSLYNPIDAPPGPSPSGADVLAPLPTGALPPPLPADGSPREGQNLPPALPPESFQEPGSARSKDNAPRASTRAYKPNTQRTQDDEELLELDPPGSAQSRQAPAGAAAGNRNAARKTTIAPAAARQVKPLKPVAKPGLIEPGAATASATDRRTARPGMIAP